MTEDEAQTLKFAWRDSNPWAPRFWAELEQAARDAVNDPGVQYPAGRVTYYSTEEVLWAILPSGHTLAYPDPKVEEIETQIGVRPTVTCMKGSFRPKQGQKDWPRMRLWGGIQAENATQGEAAAVLRYGARELARNGWPLVGHTHDELLLEVPNAEVEEAKAALHDIMTHPPECFAGLPLAAKVMAGVAYGK
jgi:DNA polymerase